MQATGFCKPVLPIGKAGRCLYISSKEGCKLREILKRFYFVLRARRVQGGDFGLRKQIDRCITVVGADAVCFCRQWRGCLSGVFTGSAACWTVKPDSSFQFSSFFLFFLLPQCNSTHPLPVLHLPNIRPSLSLNRRVRSFIKTTYE